MDRGQKQLEAVIHAMQDGVVVFDGEGRSILINAAEARICGYESPSEMERELAYFAEIFELTDMNDHLLPVQEWPVSRVLRGETISDVELCGRRRDTGQKWTFSFSGTPVFDESGHDVALAVIVTRDITDRRRLEEQLRQALKMEAVGHLAGGVAHDFNNLLGVIVGYGDLLLSRSELSPQDLRRVVAIREAADRAAALTGQLLAFSRKQILKPRVIDLNEVVGNVVEMLRRLIGENVRVVLSLGPEVGRVEADPHQIEQVVLNLAVNARDAMPAGGTLVIETRNVEIDEGYARLHLGTHPGQHVMLAVSDTGHGMDAEVLRHIFEPFYTTKDPGKGTGLGLSSVYGIVKQSNGSVEVYSEVDRGTTFKVYLPRVDRPRSTADAENGRGSGEAGSETILLVEDDASLRAMVCEILNDFGYSVIPAASVVEAVAVVTALDRPLHLVISDVVLPGASGRRLAELLESLRPGVPVVFMSGYTSDAIEYQAVLETGAEFIGKPFTARALLEKVRAILDGTSGRRPD